MSSLDPNDPLEAPQAALLAALRDEDPPAGAQARALRAAQTELRARSQATGLRRAAVWGAALTAVAAAAVVALRAETPAEHISAEPAISLQRPRVAPPATSPLETGEPVTSAPPLAPRPPAPPAPPASIASLRVTLSDELAALKVATAALDAGDARGALAALDRYERVLKGKQLRAEATLLRIQALSRSGREQAASALADQFVKQNPDSPLVDRARSYVSEK